MGKSPSQLPTRRVPAAEVYRGPRARVRQVAQEGELLVVLREWSQDLPAWIVSLLVHAVAMFLLGLLSFPPDDGPIPLVLATAVDDLELEGQQADPLTNDPKAWEFEPAGSVEIGPPPRWEQLEDDRIRWEFFRNQCPMTRCGVRCRNMLPGRLPISPMPRRARCWRGAIQRCVRRTSSVGAAHPRPRLPWPAA